ILREVWRVIYADGTLDGHEDYLVHKLAKLLNLNHPMLIEAKMAVLREIRGGGQAPGSEFRVYAVLIPSINGYGITIIGHAFDLDALHLLNYSPIAVYLRAGVVKWQTRTVQVRVGVSPWGFKSLLRHHNFDIIEGCATARPFLFAVRRVR